VCEDPGYQNSQLLCELFSVWNTDEEICVGWRYADSNGASIVPLMGKEGAEGDNTFTYMNQGEIPYLKIYDSYYGSILDLNPGSELPGWQLNTIETIAGTSTAWNEGLGCTNPQACNYDEDATINDGCLENDCMGGCGGNAFQNECNVCVGGNTGNPLDAGLDCMGECFGGAQIDVCGVCNGPGSVYGCGCSEISEGDCDCDGNVLDCFDVCGGNAVLDCSGVCGGSAVVDECDECGGDGIDEGACDCDGNILDCAGACGGDGDYLADGTTCCASGNIDCNDVCNGLANYNDCFVCVGGDTGLTEDTGIDCLGACWGSAVEDECGVCNGDGSSCDGTLLVPYEYATIQEAIDYSIDGDTVFVYAGTYSENINFNGKNIVVMGENRETTIIDGNQSGDVVTFENGENATAIITDFTVQSTSDNVEHVISCIYSSPTINSLIIQNSPSAAIYMNYSNPVIKNSIIDNTQGILVYADSSPLIDNCLIINHWGGSNNSIHISSNSNALIVNTTITQNNRGLTFSHEGSAIIKNTIIWGNTDTYHGEQGPNNPQISFSLLEEFPSEGTDGGNNLYSDPQFTDPDNGDFTLQPTSPCIDTGDPESEFDPDGTRADMGAYPTYQNSFDLHAGANLISFYVLPDDKSVTNMLSSLGDNATGIIGEGVAASQINGNWSGSLTTIAEESGYWVTILETDELRVFGEPVNGSEVEYGLHSGANLLSYPYEGSNSIESALTENAQANLTGIIGEGVAANNSSESGWMGSLNTFDKNKGYWLISSAAFNMYYNEPTGLARLSSSTLHTNFNQSSQQAFYFIESIENIEQGDIIHTYSNGINVGSRMWNGSFTDIPAMGDDGSKFTAGYCIDGSIPAFKVEKANGSLITLTGDIPEWSNNQLYMVGYLEESIALPAVYSLSTAYPNPFNPTTTLSFAIPVDSEVSLSIYNLQGREVMSLINGNMDAGYHSVVWNADAHASGVYFVKMVAGEYINTQKLMLMK